MTAEAVLRVEDLVTRFYTEEGVVKAVDGNSITLHEGEILGIVGESGSGKSVSALSIMGLIDSPGRIESGTIRYRGEDLLEKTDEEMRRLRGDKISMVFQDPMSSLNPVYTVGSQIARVVREHRGVSKRDARERTIELMREVGIPEPEARVDNYPHEFSGGMLQRALLAMAISCDPDVLIADEPTTALDVTIEAQIFEVLDDLQEKYGMSIILITHDLGVVAGTCDRVAVAYAGRIVERATVDALFENPRHPYTRGLMRSIPRVRGGRSRLTPIEGQVPNLTALPSGCSFSPRCVHATEECRTYDPELRTVEPGREAACIHARGYGAHDVIASREEVADD
ncbi:MULTISPECIES: ABC transporter ATP-binding protein [unclassified Haladaptatus]|uniref:ABC transporter ATP-binding protein n=1 Tax=unclassified Haladaptatus TaxID=2622732 RepID=UPI00209BE72D|nr:MULTISPECIES: ABC transporter ATP-binding protein [unclassified Haladaptatus]MCO8243772.1 ABC transporter ATP-binding protein [Haladaptatus sp. AB643]MCO8256713.1 ABC transporter ATP-binding protein [Haladaptatus sp. AB618]